MLHSYPDLLEEEPRGFFFLQNALSNYAHNSYLDRIMKQSEEMYQKYIGKSGSAFTPIFNFSLHQSIGEKEMKLRLEIKEPSDNVEDKIVGHLDLTTIIDTITKYPTLSLQKKDWESVTKVSLQNLKLVELKVRFTWLMESLDEAQQRLLIGFIKLYGNPFSKASKTFTFDITIHAQGFDVLVYKEKKRLNSFSLYVN